MPKRKAEELVDEESIAMKIKRMVDPEARMKKAMEKKKQIEGSKEQSEQSAFSKIPPHKLRKQ